MSDRLVLGIDPGLSGAVALVATDLSVALAEALPTMDVGPRRSVDAEALARLLRPYLADIRLAVVEQVGAMPRQGVSSMFRFGRAVGAVEGTLGALHIRTQHTPPAVWKRAVGLTSADKEAARGLARRLFPSVPLDRKKDHGIAEALLIALHGINHSTYKDAP